MEAELRRVREWAQERAQSGIEPPWAWYQYMKLMETCDAILGGMAVATPTESSPLSDERPGRHLRLVDSTDQRDTVPPHHGTMKPPLPM